MLGPHDRDDEEPDAVALPGSSLHAPVVEAEGAADKPNDTHSDVAEDQGLDDAHTGRRSVLPDFIRKHVGEDEACADNAHTLRVSLSAQHAPEPPHRQ